MKNIDFLAIGDIATEPFIKIKDAEATCDQHGDHCKLCLSYGGKIPYESALVCNAVGNSSNVAIGLSRLGLNTSLLSYIGNDETGKENIEELKKENVDTGNIKVINGLESNYHYVLWYGVERTILVKHTQFPYSFPKEIEEPKWIYLSSLAPDSLSYHREISEYIKSHKDVSLAFQPGTFQIRLGTEELKDIYGNTKVFLCNKQEAEKVLGVEKKEISEMLKMIHALGPKVVVITDGVNGAYGYDGNEILYMKAFPKVTVESTGAGDAFSAAFVGALFMDKSIEESLMWGAANAASVVEFVGPHKGLLTKESILEYLKNSELKPEKIS